MRQTLEKRTFLALIGGTFLLLIATIAPKQAEADAAAASVSSPASPSAALSSPAARYIDKLASETLATIKNGKLSKEKKQQVLEKIFREHIDFNWAARFAMGRFWKQSSEKQKSLYVAAYQGFIIKNYTARFLEYTSGRFSITDAKESDNGEWSVGMEISAEGSANEPPVIVEYKLRKNSGAFKVVDIVVEGVSMITTQRSEFASVINKSGIDGLIEQLSAK